MARRGDPDEAAAQAWDVEYAAGRYRDEPPLPFVADILAAAREHDLLRAEGLYIGCGNGRNYLPLVEGGLDLVGLDVSAAALAQVAERAPDCRQRLIQGDLSALPASASYPLVIGIQVFQHGDRATAHEHIEAAQARLAGGGLFCVRVTAVGTELEYEHDVVQRDRDGGFTVRYRAGPKRGLCGSTSSPRLSSRRCSLATLGCWQRGSRGPGATRRVEASGRNGRAIYRKPV